MTDFTSDPSAVKKHAAAIVLLLSLLTGIILSARLIKTRRLIKPRAAGAPGAQITPAGASVPVNGEFDVSVNLNSTAKLSGIKLIINYSPATLDVRQISTQSARFDDLLSANSASGIITIAGVYKKAEADLPSGTINVAQIKFLAKAGGMGAVSVDENQSQLVGPNGQSAEVAVPLSGSTGGSYTIQPGAGPTNTPTPSPTPFPTPAPGSQIQLDFKIAINGIGASSHPDLSVRLRVLDETTATAQPSDFSNILLSADAAGLYRVKTPLALGSLKPGPNYTLYVKGPKHLQKRMVKRTDLTKGANVFDWTNKPLECGDLPDPNKNYQQDGVVNTIDLGIITSRLEKQGEPDLRAADCNYDNQINLNDYSLVLYTLSSKYDEDNY